MIYASILTRDSSGDLIETQDSQIPVTNFVERFGAVFLGAGWSETIDAVMISPVKLSAGQILIYAGLTYRVVKMKYSIVKRHKYYLQLRGES